MRKNKAVVLNTPVSHSSQPAQIQLPLHATTSDNSHSMKVSQNLCHLKCTSPKMSHKPLKNKHLQNHPQHTISGKLHTRGLPPIVRASRIPLNPLSIQPLFTRERLHLLWHRLLQHALPLCHFAALPLCHLNCPTPPQPQPALSMTIT